MTTNTNTQPVVIKENAIEYDIDAIKSAVDFVKCFNIPNIDTDITFKTIYAKYNLWLTTDEIVKQPSGLSDTGHKTIGVDNMDDMLEMLKMYYHGDCTTLYYNNETDEFECTFDEV